MKCDKLPREILHACFVLDRGSEEPRRQGGKDVKQLDRAERRDGKEGRKERKEAGRRDGGGGDVIGEDREDGFRGFCVFFYKTHSRGGES
jgi:hypothetical protein